MMTCLEDQRQVLFVLISYTTKYLWHSGHTEICGSILIILIHTYFNFYLNRIAHDSEAIIIS